MPILGVAGDVIERRQIRTSRSQRLRIRRRKRRDRRRAARVAKLAKPTVIVEAKPKHNKNVGKGRLRNFQLYALRLKDDCYYVGMTAYSDARVRFKEHAAGGKQGAMWTKAHRPLEIIETRQVGYIYESEAAKLETAMTIEYLVKYGTHAVRGGDMCYMDERLVKNKFDAHLARIGRCS